MLNQNYDTTYDMIYVIINQGLGSKVLHKAREMGIKGGTVCFGLGTINQPLLNFLALYDEHKEVIILGGDNTTITKTIDHLNKTFKFHKPNHGIMYRINSCRMLGSRFNECSERTSEKEIVNMYHIITTIVDKGRGEEVVSASRTAGARGGTIINARGSGVNSMTKVFNMEIEPEKEIVVIVAKANESEAIVQKIYQELDLDQPGHGILFVQPAAEVHGLFHESKSKL